MSNEEEAAELLRNFWFCIAVNALYFSCVNKYLAWDSRASPAFTIYVTFTVPIFWPGRPGPGGEVGMRRPAPASGPLLAQVPRTLTAPAPSNLLFHHANP